MERVLISLGSNLLNPLKQVDKSLHALASYSPHIQIIACSSYYRSRPLMKIQQPDFLNVVVIIDTDLSPIALLNYVQLIETQQGRIRTHQRWASRTLDIDILLFGNRMFSIPRLVVPHYGIFNREFILYPLFELIPNFSFLNGKTLSEYIRIVPKNGLQLWK